MRYRILQGDVLDRLRELPESSVQCVVTSPPYWRQRNYGMSGQMGLEQTPEIYTDRMVEVFREARRILREDGTLWLNLGDKWASGGNGDGGYKDKDLVGVPWMVAFALRADGWYLRQCNIWAKPNCMPESVRDRSTASHEYVFQLSKSNDYFYDNEAARTPAAPSSETRLAQDVDAQNGSDRGNGGAKSNGPMKAVRSSDKQRGHSRRHNGFNDRWDAMSVADQRAMGANLRSVWWISPAQYGDDHFAVMPDRLAEICIRAGSREGDIVLDPFNGAGTTGIVALRHGRNYIGIELNSEYAAMAQRRIADDRPLFNVREEVVTQ